MTNSPTLHLICGRAGAGKTTYAKILEKKTGAIRFTKDEWITKLYGRNLSSDQWSDYEKCCYLVISELVQPILKHEIDVILDYGFWYKHERREAKDLASSCNALCLVHYLNTSDETRKQRILNRNKTIDESSVTITDEDFHMQLDWFEEPVENEGISVNKIDE